MADTLFCFLCLRVLSTQLNFIFLLNYEKKKHVDNVFNEGCHRRSTNFWFYSNLVLLSWSNTLFEI